MKTLSLKFERLPGGKVWSGFGFDLGVSRLTMRKRTNSSGPGGLIRRALRIGVLVALALGLVLLPGSTNADAQAHGRIAHFSGGGFRAGRAGRAWGARGGWQNNARANRHFARQQLRQQRRNNQNIRGGGNRRFNNSGSRRMQPVRRGSNGAAAMRPAYHPQQNMNRNMPGIRAGAGGFNTGRPGQEHLPQWWAAHRGLSPQQQADAMRREPGFRNLPQRQQQRLLNRLRNFDSRSPQVQRRTLNRVEMFERLSPERQQEVRGASAAFNRMAPQEKQRMIQAFQNLRHMPPEQRDQMLHSSYGQQFSPQERTVLGNLLSIEPYQPSNAMPYFGRPH